MRVKAARASTSLVRAAIFSAVTVIVLAAAMYSHRAVLVVSNQYDDFHPPRSSLPVPPRLSHSGMRPVSFDLDDGATIAGWLLPSHNGAVVIFVHGSPGERSGFLPVAESLHRAGYGALLLDMPGHGESGGEANWGAQTLLAVERSVDVASQQLGARHVALLGYSMGSYIVTQVAAKDARVGALILLAPFTELADQLRYQYRSRVPFLSELAVLATRAAGVPVDEMRTIDALRASRARPLLIIAGDSDGAIHFSMPRELYAVAAEPKQLWIVEGAHHVDIRETAQPVAFDERVRVFLDQAFID